MKLKFVWVLCLALVLPLLLCACGNKVNDPNREINEPYFGKELYAEVCHNMTQEEKNLGEEVLRQMQDTLEYAGPETDASTDVGALSKYYWFPYHEQPAKAEASAELVSCVRQDDEFHVWVLYSRTLFGEDGELYTGCWDILAFLTVASGGDGWIVTEAREHP